MPNIRWRIATNPCIAESNALDHHRNHLHYLHRYFYHNIIIFIRHRKASITKTAVHQKVNVLKLCPRASETRTYTLLRSLRGPCSFGWEERQVWFIPLADERGVCR